MMPGVAALQPARFAPVLSAVFRTTPALPSSQRNTFHTAVAGSTLECGSSGFGDIYINGKAFARGKRPK